MSRPSSASPSRRFVAARRLGAALLVGAAGLGPTACAQERDAPPRAPRPAPAPASAPPAAARVPLDSIPPTARVRLLPAPEALARLEANLTRLRGAFRGVPGPPEPEPANELASIAATGDSATYFAPLERLARAYAAEQREGGAYAYGPLRTLRSFGARRPYFRALALNPEGDPWLAGAAVRVLAEDPREEEADELRALRSEMFRRGMTSESGGFAEAVGYYGARMYQARRYDALPDDVAIRTTFLIERAGNSMWRDSRLRALYLRDPAAVEAAIVTYVPPPPPSDILSPIHLPQVPIEYYHAEMLEIARAPASVVLPPEIEDDSE